MSFFTKQWRCRWKTAPAGGEQNEVVNAFGLLQVVHQQQLPSCVAVKVQQVVPHHCTTQRGGLSSINEDMAAAVCRCV